MARTDPEIEGQLRVTLRAVARQVPAHPPHTRRTPLDLDASAPPAKPRSAPLLLSAAAVVAFLLLSILAVRGLTNLERVDTGPASPSPTDGRPTGGTPAPVRTTDPEQFPRLAPTVPPTGFLLERADSGTAPSVAPGWVSYWMVQIRGSMDPGRLIVRVHGPGVVPNRPPAGPRRDTDGVERPTSVDVNGIEASVEVGPRDGFRLVWPADGGRQVEVMTRGDARASYDEVVAVARAVRLEPGSLTAEVDARAVPARFERAYVGTDLSSLVEQGSEGATSDSFRYHDARVRRTVTVHIVNGVAFDPAGFRTGMPTTAEVSRTPNGLSLLGTPPDPPGVSGDVAVVVGGDEHSVFEIQARDVPVDVLYRFAAGFRSLDRAEWKQLVATADSPDGHPVPPGPSVCMDSGEARQLAGTLADKPPLIAWLNDHLTPAPGDAPADVVAGLTRLRDVLVTQNSASEPPRIDWSAFRQSFAVVDPWYRQTCGTSAAPLFQAAGPNHLLQPDPAIEPFCSGLSSFEANLARQNAPGHIPTGATDALDHLATIAPEPLLALTLSETAKRWRGHEGTPLPPEEQNGPSALNSASNYALSHCADY
jgi:hypothetical protein